MSLCLFNEGSTVLNFTELLEKQILSRIESLKVRVSLLLDWLKLNRVFFLHLTGLIGEWPVSTLRLNLSFLVRSLRRRMAARLGIWYLEVGV